MPDPKEIAEWRAEIAIPYTSGPTGAQSLALAIAQADAEHGMVLVPVREIKRLRDTIQWAVDHPEVPGALRHTLQKQLDVGDAAALEDQT